MTTRPIIATVLLLAFGLTSPLFAQKGDSTKAEFMETQQAQYEKKGWNRDDDKMEKMFAEMDADGDGILSGDEKKAYWAQRNASKAGSAAGSQSTSADEATSTAPAAQRSSAAADRANKTSDIDPTTSADVQPFEGTPIEGYRIAFSDEFNGTEVDESKWEYRLDSKHWSTQLAVNNSVSDGNCVIHLRKEKSQGKDYTGGGIISKKYFRYGYYEARIKCPTGAGWHTSFWMMDNHHVKADTSQVELDPLETNSINVHEFSTDYHQWRSDIGHMKRYQLVKTPDAPLNEFQVYGMEWKPDGAYFYFNGKLVRTATDLTQQLPKEEKQAGKKPVVRDVADTDKNDVQIWFTGLGTWLGNTKAVDDSKLPETAECDYIRFFESDASLAAMEGVAVKPDVTDAQASAKKLARGDSTLESFLSAQKAQQEKKGHEWNQKKYEKMFQQMDADGDGIVSGDEKKAYWSK